MNSPIPNWDPIGVEPNSNFSATHSLGNDEEQAKPSKGKGVSSPGREREAMALDEQKTELAIGASSAGDRMNRFGDPRRKETTSKLHAFYAGQSKTLIPCISRTSKQRESSRTNSLKDTYAHVRNLMSWEPQMKCVLWVIDRGCPL